MKYHIDFFEKDGKSFLYNQNVNSSYVCTSSHTAFEVKFLLWFDVNMIRNTMSFSRFCEAFNEFNFENEKNNVKN